MSLAESFMLALCAAAYGAAFWRVMAAVWRLAARIESFIDGK